MQPDLFDPPPEPPPLQEPRKCERLYEENKYELHYINPEGKSESILDDTLVATRKKFEAAEQEAAAMVLTRRNVFNETKIINQSGCEVALAAWKQETITPQRNEKK